MLRITNAKTAFFTSKEHYLKFRQAWKDYVNAGGTQTSQQLLIYSLLREKPENHSFTPITNPNKLRNGASALGALTFTKNNLAWLNKSDSSIAKREREVVASSFGGTINEATIKYLVSLMSKTNSDFTVPGEAECAIVSHTTATSQ